MKLLDIGLIKCPTCNIDMELSNTYDKYFCEVCRRYYKVTGTGL